jgi:2-dehydropantoate 2-reductase
MRICILGAGALGSVMGGTLAEAGHDVTLVSRNRSHVDAINTAGLILRSDGKDRIVPLVAAVSTTTLHPVDLVIVLVKSLDTQDAMEASRNLVGPETVVMSLQNGLGQEDILAQIVGKSHVIAGKTYVGGVMLAAGHVMASTSDKETMIGELNGEITPRISAIAEVFSRAGLATIVPPDITVAMWEKLLVNIATGAVAAITGLSYGALYAVPEIEMMAIAAVAESMAVARATGITLQTSDPRAPWVKASTGLPPEFRTSMLQSLDKGGLTEIDCINGAVLRAGAKVGIPTPVNAALVALVKGIERRVVPAAVHDAPPETSRQASHAGAKSVKKPDELYYDEVKLGDEGTTSEVTVTKDMIKAYADLTGDHTPVHVDEAFAKASHFGGIVAHGLFGLSLADGLKTQGSLQFPPGSSLGWNWDFKQPIRADDRLHVKYRVAAMRETKKPGWGILTIASELINQAGDIVQQGEHKLMILKKPEVS